MLYRDINWVKSKGWRPLPPLGIEHFMFLSHERDIDNLYRPMTRDLWEIKDEVREWLWYNIDRQTDPWIKHSGGQARNWAYDLARKLPKMELGLNGYLAFKSKDDAMLFKMAWA